MKADVRLGLFVPTRDRPHNAVRLAKKVGETCNPRVTQLEFIIDHDDPQKQCYLEMLHRDAPWAEVVCLPPTAPARLGPVLNYHAKLAADSFDFVGFMGDDHLPKTPLWDERLCWSLAGKPGVAYGDDLLQRERLPTACVISAELVRILGYMSPPPLVHLFLDDFWRLLGEATQLVYRRDVIIEHLHPAAAKAPMDRGYAESGLNAELMRDDGWRWEQWREQVWPGEVKRLRRALDG